jgi:Carboxypeptidase regulatory-like domain/TonB dependent receptor
MSIRNLWGIFVLSFCVCVTTAQNTRGTLRGTVLDPSGARVPSARVVVQAADFGFKREAVSNERGEFRLDDLPVTAYRIMVSANGFADASATVDVSLGFVGDLTIALKPAEDRQTVRVEGQVSSITTQSIDTASAVHQAIVTSRDLETIPLSARSFANNAYLAPGTEPVEPSDPTKARITAVSTGGSSGLNNDLSVDGGDNSDDYIGGFLQNISPEAIREFAVRTALEDADTGRTTAGSVVITTKRGTDDWHGEAAFYERTAGLNARFPIDNPAPNPKQAFSRQNYVGTLGGPIVKDKLWFFSSFEYVRENASIAYSSDSQDQFNALAQLAAEGLVSVNGTRVDSISVPSSVPVPFRDYLGLLRLDWAQSSNSQWFLRAAIDNYTTRNALVQQGTLPSTGATTHNNYMNMALSNQHVFSPAWVGSFVFDASGLHLTASRNDQFGFALAFPFSSTSSTISGLETFGDNQFVTAITAFPVLRNQEKYQFRYDVTNAAGHHAPRFGVNFIHEPVLSGALAATAETFVTLPENPTFYLADPPRFTSDIAANSVFTPAGDGSFSQNVQRLGLYVEDSWRVTPRLTVNYGLRYDTSFGLFDASGRSQSQNPYLLSSDPAAPPFISSAPNDYRKAFAPRLGVAYSLGSTGNTVLRGGMGMYYADLAQNGWVTAFQAVNDTNVGSSGGIAPPSIIDPNYHTPYAIHATVGIQHAFHANWSFSTDWTLETGMHSYRRYDFPTVSVFRSDNRSSYNALSLHLQGNVARRLSLVANYTVSSAKTWGCEIGELFDYVNGVCDPFNAFAPGDYGPSGEDVRHRAVLAGTIHARGGFELTFLSQAESARPITLVTPVGDRAVINGVKSRLDEFRGTPYLQTDLRVSRPFRFREHWTAAPFVEFFNLFNRNNPGNNYVPDISALPIPVNDLSNVTALCLDPACGQTVPVTSGKQLLVPSGALGDFFGPGTTVGIPIAAQVGLRLTY